MSSNSSRKRKIEEPQAPSTPVKASKQSNGERSKSPTRKHSSRAMKHGIALNPSSAYSLWIEDFKKRIDPETIPKSAQQQSSFFSKEWHNVSAEKKTKWEQKAAQEKIKWQKEVANFFEENGFWHDEEVKEAKETKRKESRDKPKPLNGYTLFVREQREAVSAENEGMAPAVVMAEVAKRWSALSKEEKEEYRNRAVALGPVESSRTRSRSKRASKKEQVETEEDGNEEEGEAEGEEAEEEGEGEEEVPETEEEEEETVAEEEEEEEEGEEEEEEEEEDSD